MYEIFNIIYGKVLNSSDVTRLEEVLPDEEIEDWIGRCKFGDCPYSGTGDETPMYIGVPLDAIDFSNHGKSIHDIKLGPTDRDRRKYNTIIQRIQEEYDIDITSLLEFEPGVFIVHSTS
jgi:hypothetical protein